MSDVTTLARPYARAAFEVARQQDALQTWDDALGFAATVAADQRVLHLIGDPGVDNQQLVDLFQPGSAPEGFDNLLRLLVDNDRLAVLPEIAENYAALKHDAEQVLKVRVLSAVELDSAYQEKLVSALGQRFDRTVELSCEVDKELIGGALIQAGDVVIDGTLRGKLRRMTEALMG